MAQVTMFEIQAADPARAAAFYSQAFGWRFEAMDRDYYRLVGHEPLLGMIFRRPGPDPEGGAPLNAWACILKVDDIGETLARIEAAGGRVTVPRYPVPGIGWSAYFRDTEGNTAGVFQADPSAAYSTT